ELRKHIAEIRDNSDAMQEKINALIALKDSLAKEAREKGIQSQAKQKRIEELLADLDKLNEKKAGVEKVLAQRLKDIDELEKKLGLLGKRNTTLEEDLTASKAAAELKGRRIDDLLKQADT